MCDAVIAYQISRCLARFLCFVADRTVWKDKHAGFFLLGLLPCNCNERSRSKTQKRKTFSLKAQGSRREQSVQQRGHPPTCGTAVEWCRYCLWSLSRTHSNHRTMRIYNYWGQGGGRITRHTRQEYVFNKKKDLHLNGKMVPLPKNSVQNKNLLSNTKKAIF